MHRKRLPYTGIRFMPSIYTFIMHVSFWPFTMPKSHIMYGKIECSGDVVDVDGRYGHWPQTYEEKYCHKRENYGEPCLRASSLLICA